MKKLTSFMTCLLLIGTMFNPLQAQKIAYSGSNTGSDKQVIEGLTALGYEVTVQSTLGSALTTDKAATLNTYDLVIIGRSSQSSGNYASTYNAAWQTVSVPVLNCFNYGFRSARAQWFETAGNTVSASNFMVADSTKHPIFTNLSYDATSYETVQLGSDGSPGWHTVATTTAGNGKVLAHSASSEGNVTIVEWAPNTEMWDGRGIHAGKRMIFPLSDGGEGMLTEDGVLLYTDIVEYLLTGTVSDKLSPTDITISSDSFPVNTPSGAPIGEFSAVDPQDNAIAYALVAGEGDDDNASFTISGTALVLNVDLDANDDKEIDSGDPDLSIRVQVTDATGKTFEKAIALTVTPFFDGPLDIFLDNASILENQTIGTAVGVLSASDVNGDIKMYELVEGSGDEGNAAFMIDGDILKSDTTFNYEDQTSFSVRIMVTDSTDQVLTKVFTINIDDVDESPTDIAIDVDSIDENIPAGTMIATISGTDPQDDIASFELADGDGNNHNPYFYIDGTGLYTNAEFDYEFFQSLTVNIRATDSEGSYYEESIAIKVLDKEDILAPTANEQYTIAFIGNANDQGYVDLLEANGYDVVLAPAEKYVSAQIDSLNSTYDLIVISRTVGSSSYTNPTVWDSITTPVINMSSYVARSSRLKYINTGSATGSNDMYVEVQQPNHLLFSNVGANAVGDSLEISTVKFNSNPWVQGNGLLLATYPNGQVAMAEWKAGLPFYNGAGLNVQAGRRMIFHGGSSYGLTALGDTLFLDAVEYMITGSIGAPNEIALEKTVITENPAMGATVDTLVAYDRYGEVASYALVEGEGADDNALFSVDGDILKVADVISYETKDTLSIRVQATDTEGNTYDEIIKLTVLDAPDAPYSIAIDGTEADELVEAGVLVGMLSAMDDDMDADAFALVAGEGDADNASFIIDTIFSYSDKEVYSVDSTSFTVDTTIIPNDTIYAIDTTVVTIENIDGLGLYTAVVFDYETQADYSVRIEVTDATGLTFSDAIALKVIDINENPTDISYSGYKFTENNEIGAVVGSLTAEDPQNDVATFSLVSGAGDTDNDKVSIDGTDVKANVVFDYEAQVLISFRVKVEDQFGNSYEEILYTSIMDDPSDNPTKPSVLSTVGNIEETEGFGTKEIDLSKIFGDEDGDTLTYEFKMSNDTVISLAVDNANNKLTITEKAVGIVTVILTAKDNDDNEASDMFRITIVEGTSSISELSANSITAYPNPSTTGVFKIKMKNTKDAQVIINDMLGRTVAQQAFNQREAEIDLSGMPSGNYFATIRANDQVFVKQLIKE